ncbi:hypothetical protein [Caldithrix abyssi]
MVEWLNSRQPGIANSDQAGKAPVHVFVGAKDFHHYFFIGMFYWKAIFFQRCIAQEILRPYKFGHSSFILIEEGRGGLKFFFCFKSGRIFFPPIAPVNANFFYFIFCEYLRNLREKIPACNCAASE